MGNIQPIETPYKGYRFRSRLEARWAVFFDVLGMKWEYEREGYDLNNLGWYLPDFYVISPLWPKMALWVEVKPEVPAPAEIAKLSSLVRHTQKCGIALSGVPGDETIKLARPNYNAIVNTTPMTYWRVLIREVQDRKEAGIAKVQAAYTAARSARFEHGETPRPPKAA